LVILVVTNSTNLTNETNTTDIIDMDNREILLIHLGGLGDMCLSESTFLSLSRHFNKNLVAVGYRRFLTLFEEYFSGLHSVESRHWLYLFSEMPSKNFWERIVFIGKDREGRLRKRWQQVSKEPLIFIDMYPENSRKLRGQGVKDSSGFKTLEPLNPRTLEPFHMEDYQLAQLEQYGIQALRKEIKQKRSDRVILYPERGFEKVKWHHDNFVQLYQSLKSKGREAYILEALGLHLDIQDKVSLKELSEIRDFFQEGGIFVSNDSGMAHLAGMCGLFTITIFTDFDPHIWHPRGRYITLKYGEDKIDVPSIEAKVMEIIGEWKPKE
jgi:ADP-heptose:LPS heptosyltransferase